MLTIPPLAVAALWFALILAVTAGFLFFVIKWAGKSDDAPPTASDLLTKFRDLHASGGLSDAEYRTIKTKLAPGLTNSVPGAGQSPAEGEGRPAVDPDSLSVFRLLSGGGEAASEEG